MPKVLIIADDLTGAADCGVMFRRRGMETVVLLGKPGEGTISAAELRSAEVVAIDADTRCMGAGQAGEIVGQLVRFCDDVIRDDSDRPLLFKKVDSTLRGNVGAELAAVLNARRALIPPPGRVRIVFAPAFPALGRTTVNGRQMVHGAHLEETDVWRGERTRPHAEIAQMLGEAGLACATIDLALVRGELSVLGNTMARMANEFDALACDAETEEDLRAIARAAMVLDKGTTWAGSAGLARHLANAAELAPAIAEATPRIRVPQVQGPTLFAVGSQATVSHEQADVLADAAGLAGYRVRASTLEEKQYSEWEECATRIVGSLADGKDVLVRIDPIATGADQDRRMARSVARMLAPCAVHAGALVATGGDTARAILDAWGIKRLILEGDVEPGLPYSSATCGDRNILVLTKAGSFGARDTLLNCRAFLERLGRDSNVVESTVPAENGKS